MPKSRHRERPSGQEESSFTPTKRSPFVSLVVYAIITLMILSLLSLMVTN